MELIELGKDEYEKFASSHENSNFIQNIYFSELKKKNRWEYVVLGIKDKNNIVAAVSLHYRNIKFGYKMYYAPRGYLLDYSNFDLFKLFDKLITNYVKKNKGIALKIDPYLINKERDKDGKIVSGGLDNTKFITLLKKLGYQEEGNNVLQIKWMYRINIKNKSFEDITKDMTSKTRQMIRKNEKLGVAIREGKLEDLEEFNEILSNTADRRGFVSRPLQYIKDMYNIYEKGNHIKLIFADLAVEDTITKYQNEIIELQDNLLLLKENKKLGKNKISEEKLLEKEEEINKLTQNIEKYQEMKNKYGKKITLGGIIYLNYGREVLSFIGGSYKDFMEYQPFYTIHYEMIRYAIEKKYDYYNFYGISGNFDPKDSMYGIYQFKRGFGGEVVELIGEFDKKISPLYSLYKIIYKIYRNKK